MPDILAAVDETAATKIFNAAEAALGKLSRSGSDNLGPFVANWSANASFSGGTTDLIAPDVIRLQNVTIDYSLSFSFSIDLAEFLGDFCLPGLCLSTPFGEICIPRICVPWPPPISVGILGYPGTVSFDADFRPIVYLDGAEWVIAIEIVDVPSLDLGLETSGALATILFLLGRSLTAKLALIPFMGPFLPLAVSLILAAIGGAALLGLLGSILAPFLSGLRFEIYRRKRLFEVLPFGGPLDPAVFVTIDSLAVAVQSTDEDELVITANISA